MLIKNLQYILRVSNLTYNLDTMVKSKPVSGFDTLTLALIHHWGKDTSVFPNER